MAQYTWNGKTWVDNSNGTTSSSAPGPGPGNTLVFAASTTSDVLLSPGNLTGGPTEFYGKITLNAGVSAVLGTFSSNDTASYDHFAVSTVSVGAHATLTLSGSIEGRPATEGMQADHVILAAGAKLLLGAVPVDGPDKIGSLTNNGGMFVAPTGTSSVAANDLLQLGGPGFVQISGFTSGESESNNGAGATTVNLGSLTQGSVAAAIDEMISNAPAGGTFRFMSSDGAFSFSQSATALGVNTTALGSHSALLSYTHGSVHDTLKISDKIVA